MKPTHGTALQKSRLFTLWSPFDPKIPVQVFPKLEPHAAVIEDIGVIGIVFFVLLVGPLVIRTPCLVSFVSCQANVFPHDEVPIGFFPSHGF